jgi:antitoxin component YwqK of YwqJK toxin-antitoxin module
MSILHDAYTALLAGLTHKTGNEIHWYNEYNNTITIEPIDTENEKYIVRKYYPGGQKYCEIEYQNNQRNGKYLRWYDNGQKWMEIEYQNDQRHGIYLEWFGNGQKYWEKEYKNGQLHGKYLVWSLNGKKCYDLEYQNNDIIKENI